MNRLKRIFSSLSDIGIVPPADAIRRAWGTIRTAIDAHEPMVVPGGAEPFALAVKLIDRIVLAVALIAEDADKPSAKSTSTEAK